MSNPDSVFWFISSAVFCGALFTTAVLFAFVRNELKREGWKVTVQNQFVLTTFCLNGAVIMAGIIYFTRKFFPFTYYGGQLLTAISQFFVFAAVGCHIRLLLSRVSSIEMANGNSFNFKLFKSVVFAAYIFLAGSLVMSLILIFSSGLLLFLLFSGLFLLFMIIIDIYSTFIFHHTIRGMEKFSKVCMARFPTVPKDSESYLEWEFVSVVHLCWEQSWALEINL
jgi:hypothetical protein